MSSVKEIILADILEARESRAVKQKLVIGKLSLPIICFTVNFPGMHKDAALCRSIFDEGLRTLKSMLENEKLEIANEEIEYSITGPVAYISIDRDEKSMKYLTVQIEEMHPIGRLFDIDVIGRDFRPFGRAELGIEPRRCFVCREAAHACSRSRKHSLEELLGFINTITADYFSQ